MTPRRPGRSGPIRALSMCAGQGRDLLQPPATHPRRRDVRAVLVELDAANAEVARRTADAAGLAGVRAVVGDASITGGYARVVPVDLALVCRVFGRNSSCHSLLWWALRGLQSGAQMSRIEGCRPR